MKKNLRVSFLTLKALEQCKNEDYLYSGLVTMIDSHEEALIYGLANNPEDLREEKKEFWIGNLLFISQKIWFFKNPTA